MTAAWLVLRILILGALEVGALEVGATEFGTVLCTIHCGRWFRLVLLQLVAASYYATVNVLAW